MCYAADMSTLGELIRAERERHGFTLAQIGEAAGVGRGHICDIEHGRRRPSYGVCMAILCELGLSQKEAMREFLVAPEVEKWARETPTLSILLETLAHFEASPAEVEELANMFVRWRG